MIILRGEKPEFKSWDEIINETKTKRINCPDVSNRKLINALKVISSVTHTNLFKKPEFDFIHGLLNQIRYYTPERYSEHHSFVDELYGISKLIKRFKKIPSSNKLFNADIFSNFGMYSQFLITVYISKKLKIVDLEVPNKPINTDILVEHKGNELHFHCKDIREYERQTRLDDAIAIVDHILTERARTRGGKKRLALSKFDGVPPVGLDSNFWEQFAKSLEERPQTINKVFLPSISTENTEPVNIKITFAWREFSGIFTSASGSFNNQLRLEQEYDKLNNLLQGKKIPKNQIHILVTITDDKYNCKSLKQSIKDEKVGLLLLDLIEFMYTRSPFILPKSYQKIEDDLNKIFPECVEFIFNN